MIRTQIYLTEKEQQELLLIARKEKTSQSAIIRQAIDEFIIARFQQQKDQSAILKSAKGLWANRDDLPNFSKLRKEWDRE